MTPAPLRRRSFTANLNVDYKAVRNHAASAGAALALARCRRRLNACSPPQPAPASSYMCTTVDLVSEEGRKVRLSATMSERPGGQGLVYATATCLFIVAKKD